MLFSMSQMGMGDPEGPGTLARWPRIASTFDCRENLFEKGRSGRLMVNGSGTRAVVELVPNGLIDCAAINFFLRNSCQWVGHPVD
jgi:hypothetical protein